MIVDSMALRMTEAEVAHHLHTVLVKRRKMSEVTAALEAGRANAVLDEDSARHAEEMSARLQRAGELSSLTK